MAGLETGLIAVGAGLAVLGGAVGTGYAQGNIGSAGMGLLAERESAFGQVIILLALPETIVLLGFIIAFLLIGNLG
ncbi:ATPase [Candidatus Micrarchaeota archaeon]|nr:ATPase [Candidatus Micrarchaeota archaeon]